jgi:pilus assembly protein CpaE
VDLGVPDSRIFVVVNRYRRNLTVTLDDVQRALARERVSTVPNHYQTVLASIDGGVPVCELDKTSAVAKAIVELETEITGTPHVARRSLLRRAWPLLSGG